MNILERADLAAAAAAYAAACEASREHSRLAAAACARYGDHGPQISGIVRDHFPDEVKNRLRKLAVLITKYGDRGDRLRPRGVRHSTMRELARAVAARDGSGFYGPRA